MTAPFSTVAHDFQNEDIRTKTLDRISEFLSVEKNLENQTD